MRSCKFWLLCLLLLGAGLAFAQVPLLVIEFLDVGQGDALLITAPNGKRILIDAGPNDAPTVELLRQRGVKALDLFVTSHNDADHIGQAAEVILAFDIKRYLDQGEGCEKTTRTFGDVLDALVQRMVPVLEPSPRPFTVPSNQGPTLTITILPLPDPRILDNGVCDSNNNSVPVRIDYGEFSLFTAGDAGFPEINWFLNQYPEEQLDVDVLKVLHHGSRNNTNTRFLQRVTPEVAVISVGCGNPFGHPHQQALQLLADTGAQVYRTDLQGTVTITTDGVDYWVATQRSLSVCTALPSPTTDLRVNLNTATQAELEALPGIGPVLARRIIENRPYSSVDDLLRVSGIGPATLERLRPLVRVN
ncbi:MAG: helix-hairpin-helix domain-containing protein [Deinococcus sp.]|nr:helix-hairpin-helix domain-containing protein [Deinococcus sp.]